VLLSVLLFGLKNHVEYLSVLQFLSRHGESYWANQSLNGLLHHVVGHRVEDWQAGDFPPYHPLVYWGSMAATLAILAWALTARRGQGALSGVIDFALAALAFTAASPIAWEHHYGVLAPTFALLFVFVLLQPEALPRRRWLIALAICFVFAANCFAFAREWGGPLIVLQSYLYFAALGVLAMLRRAMSGPAPSRTSTA